MGQGDGMRMTQCRALGRECTLGRKLKAEGIDGAPCILECTPHRCEFLFSRPLGAPCLEPELFQGRGLRRELVVSPSAVGLPSGMNLRGEH